MTLELTDYSIIANALYARHECYLSYDEIRNYIDILFKMLHEDYENIQIKDTESNIIQLGDHIFVKEDEGVSTPFEVDEDFIVLLNSIYPEDIQEKMKLSRDEYRKDIKVLVRKPIEANNQ